MDRCCYCVKYRNFTWFFRVEIFWKSTVSVEFRASHLKLCGNCAFPQNFHTRKQCPATPLLLMIVRASRKSSRKRSWFHIQSGNKFCQLVTFMQDSLKAMTDISLNPFVLNASFLYPLNTSENLSEGRERVHWE